MVADGHRRVANGWNLFEEACSEAGPGELPQLLRSLKVATTPPPTTMGPPSTPGSELPMKVDPDSPQTPSPGPGTSGDVKDEPILIKLEGHKYNYRCPNCSIAPMRSKRGMDAHIRAVHTKVPILCAYCDFTSYNMDSVQRHKKTHT